jgi:hypothetical protein
VKRLVVAVLTIVALSAVAVLVWFYVWYNSGDVQTRIRYKRSLLVMTRNRAVLEIWFRRSGRYPEPGRTLALSQLAAALGPLGRRLVANDGLGRPFVYIASADGQHSWLISTGGDAVVQFKPGDPAERQSDGQADIVVEDGRFGQVWECCTECPEGIKNLPDDYLTCESLATPGESPCTGQLPKLCSDYDIQAPATRRCSRRQPLLRHRRCYDFACGWRG